MWSLVVSTRKERVITKIREKSSMKNFMIAEKNRFGLLIVIQKAKS